MSIFTEPFDAADEQIKKLLGIAIGSLTDKTEIKASIVSVGIKEVVINWDGSVEDVWPRVLEKASKLGKLQTLVEAMRNDDNFTVFWGDIDDLLTQAASEEGAEDAVDPTTATVVGRRPFINRKRLREHLGSLFGPGGDRAMIVDGPHPSGRSYTWVLVSFVARIGGIQASLIDLSSFRDVQAAPADVARMIAADLGWAAPDVDCVAQLETDARVLLGWLKNNAQNRPPVCLVFDGLDGPNVADATVRFIGDIAAAAGNDELGECRVVLLGFARRLSNPAVDPYVLRDSPLGDIALAELGSYFQAIARAAGIELSNDQVQELLVNLFGTPPPDPVPITLLQQKAAELSRIACALRGGHHG